MICPLLLYGDPVLEGGTKPIAQDSKDMQSLICDLFDTMRSHNGAGLAAPQIGRTERIFVVNEGTSNVFINPEITWFSKNKVEFIEGCLSIPGIRETVERPAQIKVKYLDRSFESHELDADGWLSRVIQHEIDHLDGIFFVDRIGEHRKNLLRNVLKRIVRKGKSH